MCAYVPDTAHPAVSLLQLLLLLLSSLQLNPHAPHNTDGAGNAAHTRARLRAQVGVGLRVRDCVYGTVPP
mgnify:CR=1 FL=1